MPVNERQITYLPHVKEFHCKSWPLLPGLGETLESLVEFPEVVMKHAVKGEYDRWKIDDKLTAKAFNPGNRTQTCFGKVEKAVGESILTDYYQFEYYDIPRLILKHIATSPEDQTWVVTEINNQQMRDWLAANGVLTHSEEVIDNAVRDREIEYRYLEPVRRQDDDFESTAD